MKIKRGEIILKNLQIKNIAKARKLAKALSIIEEECGIHEVRITIESPFICPWIDFDLLNKTEMEKLLNELLKKLK